MPDALDALLKNVPLQAADTPDEPLAVIPAEEPLPPVPVPVFTVPALTVPAIVVPPVPPVPPVPDLASALASSLPAPRQEKTVTEDAAPAAAKKKAARVKAVTERPDRSESLKQRHRAALDAVFGIPGIRYEVVVEVDLPKTSAPFKTPFGNSGRKGWVIRQIGTADAQGQGGVMHTIGASALRIGVNEYKVIDPLPKKPRGRKPKAEAAPEAVSS